MIRLNDYNNNALVVGGQVRRMEGSESFQVGQFNNQQQRFTVTGEDDDTSSLSITDAVGNVYAFSYTGVLSFASLILTSAAGELEFTAEDGGVDGNDITITIVGGVAAGNETVAVAGTDVTIEIEDGVSTAAQVKAAWDGEAAAVALASLDILVAGAIDVSAIESLAGGGETSTQIRDNLLAIIQANDSFSAIATAAANGAANIDITNTTSGSRLTLGDLVNAGAVNEIVAPFAGLPIPAGRAVVRSATDDQVMELPNAGSASADLLGIVIRKHAYSTNNNNADIFVPFGSHGEVMYRGEIYIEVDQAVAAGAPVFIRVDGGVLGIARADVDGVNAVQLLGARFLQAGAAGSVVAIRLNQ